MTLELEELLKMPDAEQVKALQAMSFEERTRLAAEAAVASINVQTGDEPQ